MESSLFNILPNEIINTITDILSIVDLMSFRLSCYYFSTIDMEISNRINAELKKYFPNAIINAIKQNNIVITGSLMLKILYNATWTPNDIDLYIKGIGTNSTENFTSIMFQNDFRCIKANEEQEENFMQSRYFRNKQYPLKINLICLDNVNPLTYINAVADLTIGKVGFYQNKLYVKNWDILINKKDYIVPLSYVTNRIYNGGEINKEQILIDMYQRQNKYIERGFTIRIPKNIDNIIKKMDDNYKNFVQDIEQIDKFDIDTTKNINLNIYLQKYHLDTNLLIEDIDICENDENSDEEYTLCAYGQRFSSLKNYENYFNRK